MPKSQEYRTVENGHDAVIDDEALERGKQLVNSILTLKTAEERMKELGFPRSTNLTYSAEQADSCSSMPSIPDGSRVVVIPRKPIKLWAFKDGKEQGSRETTENIRLISIGFTPQYGESGEGRFVTGLTQRNDDGTYEACGFDVLEHGLAVVVPKVEGAE